MCTIRLVCRKITSRKNTRSHSYTYSTWSQFYRDYVLWNSDVIKGRASLIRDGGFGLATVDHPESRVRNWQRILSISTDFTDGINTAHRALSTQFSLSTPLSLLSATATPTRTTYPFFWANHHPQCLLSLSSRSSPSYLLRYWQHPLVCAAFVISSTWNTYISILQIPEPVRPVCCIFLDQSTLRSKLQC